MNYVDELDMFFGRDYHVNDKITIRQPTIGEIVEFGEKRYFGLVGLLTAYPGDMKSVLWDAGIDYEKISDFDMFVFMTRGITADDSRILFGDDLDFSKMNVVPSPVGRPMLYDAERDIRIDENIHRFIFHYLVKIHAISKDHEHAGNEHTKQILIEMDREDRAFAARQPYKSHLKTLLSAMVNIDGFKYNHETVQGITLYQLMDSVERVQIIKSSLALLQGSYSGMIDVKKIKKDNFNFLREVKRS